MTKESKNLDRAESPKLQLYSYWRSSSSQRVRIVLNLKGLEYESKAVNLLKNEQSSPEFVKLNPLKFVPVLVDGDAVITDSFAISLYLEEKYPEHPLLPKDLKNKALNYQVASIVGSSIQPLQNLAVLNYIEERFGSNEKFPWAQYHIINGFEALEILLKDVAGKYATGDEPQLFLHKKHEIERASSLSELSLLGTNKRADAFLAPQILTGASRFEIDMSRFPTLARLHQVYDEHPAFRSALPVNQPDAPLSSTTSTD